jgi:hypothetical protein
MLPRIARPSKRYYNDKPILLHHRRKGGPFIRELCSKIVADNNIDEEARLSMNEFDYNIWKMWTQDEAGLGTLPVDRMPQLSATYDMAWQQRTSGHVYNSVSGHGSLFRTHSRKLIGLVIKSKHCKYCKAFTKNNPGEDQVPFHDCWKNHDGSSKAMEMRAAVEILVDSFENKQVVIAKLFCDDDSSIWATCQWSNADYCKNNHTHIIPKVPISKGPNKGKLQDRRDNGKLPGNIPEPIFVADPNHRRKALNGELIGVSTKSVTSTTIQ